MLLHQRGVDLLLKVMDAADHVEKLDTNQTQALLKESGGGLGRHA